MTSSEASKWDVVVIGGGHNGLVCAATLAKSGRKVLVLEAETETGGAARTDEFAPGFRVSSMAHVLNRLHPDVVKLLQLEKHGLNLSGGAGAAAMTPTPNPSPQGGGGTSRYRLARNFDHLGRDRATAIPLPLEGRG